ITEPIWTELLPGKIPPERPYTLLVDLEGILTCSKWDSAHGWRTAKRPGADYFIAYLSQFYEIVLFTTQPAMNAAPIAEKLDPYAAYMPYRLYRDATRFEPLATAEHGPNAVIKDLAYLNRPLETVIMLDTDKTHACKQKGNALILPKWNGEENDGGLVALIPFLESIGIYQPKDVRPVLLAYEDKDVAAEYAKVETARRDIEYRNWAQTAAGLFSPPSNPSNPSSSSTASTKPGPPPSYLDQKRAQAQMMYGEEQKYWAQNKDEIERLQAEDRERQMEEF
ncbi:HAD-like domain-containing protein, partial [Mrakia frigida]|uniref:protein translocase subunit TIM50 n=1 Tax=Mrakia frigida TaxID=29902 RepID=UPI003FCBF076